MDLDNPGFNEDINLEKKDFKRDKIKEASNKGFSQKHPEQKHEEVVDDISSSKSSSKKSKEETFSSKPSKELKKNINYKTKKTTSDITTKIKSSKSKKQEEGTLSNKTGDIVEGNETVVSKTMNIINKDKKETQCSFILN